MKTGGSGDWDKHAVPVIAPEALGSAIKAVADLALVIDAEGMVRSVLTHPDHPAYSDLDLWESANIRDFLTRESVPKFDRALREHQSGADVPAQVQLNHVSVQSNIESAVSYTLFDTGRDGAVLMLGRDLRQIADLQQQLVNAQITLEQDYELQREYDTRFRVLMKACHDPIVFVTVSSGRITDVNGAAASLLGQTSEELTGADFARLFEDQGKRELMADLAASALSEGHSEVALAMRGTQRTLRATPSFFRAAGERMMLCRLDEQARGQIARDTAPGLMTALFDNGPDGIVFTDAEGKITAANDAFLSLSDSSHGTGVKGRMLSDYLVRGAIDLKVLLENTARTGRMRLYATKVTGPYGSIRPVELSATYLADATRPGYAFVMRDADMSDKTRAMRDTGQSSDNRKSVVDLVGSTTLKEIVADTTDVIEKLCIETAVELTDNNRVAAAEMLGLSRQSLYVKLRKYGLLSRNDTE